MFVLLVRVEDAHKRDDDNNLLEIQEWKMGFMKKKGTSGALVGLALAILLFDISGTFFILFGPQLLYRADDPAVIDLVRKTGTTVEGVGGVSTSFQGVNILSFQAKSLQPKVGSNQSVWVYEFSDPGSANLQASLISPSGSEIRAYSGRAVSFAWVATPHLFKTGRLIVLYVGNDLSTLNLLRSALGTQFAGG